MVDLSDLLKIRRYIANQNKKQKVLAWELTEEEQKRADINESGKIDLMDILVLRRYIAASKSEAIRRKNPTWYWTN